MRNQMIQIYIEELQKVFKCNFTDYEKLQSLIKEFFGEDVSIGEIMAYYEPIIEEEDTRIQMENLDVRF